MHASRAFINPFGNEYFVMMTLMTLMPLLQYNLVDRKNFVFIYLVQSISMAAFMNMARYNYKVQITNCISSSFIFAFSMHYMQMENEKMEQEREPILDNVFAIWSR